MIRPPLLVFGEDPIGCISWNFYGLTWSALEAIPVSALFHILSHHLLRISRGVDLMSYINSRICSDPDYLDLLQFVRSEYLSAESICCFLLDLTDSIDRRLWESSSRQWILPVEIEFPLQEAKLHDVIMSYLTRRHGGNIQDKGIVTITSKSVDDSDPR
jgi:hypothetical protein